ncbi:hypothetical protein GCM10028793_02470 [Nocardiopsis oceani]
MALDPVESGTPVLRQDALPFEAGGQLLVRGSHCLSSLSCLPPPEPPMLVLRGGLGGGLGRRGSRPSEVEPYSYLSCTVPPRVHRGVFREVEPG